jgi:hypothetical protein
LVNHHPKLDILTTSPTKITTHTRVSRLEIGLHWWGFATREWTVQRLGRIWLLLGRLRAAG